MKQLVLALMLALGPTAALAEDSPIFVAYGNSNGSLPPEYAWDNSITIREDGKLEVTHCKGYATEGPDCKTRRAKVTAEAMAAIRAAALASGLAEKPAAESEYPIVGGSASGGWVMHDGQKISLISDPAETDAARVTLVIQAIEAAIPDRFDRFMNPD